MHPHRRAADRQRHRAQQRLAPVQPAQHVHYARDAGLKTAAAAYHWVSELYNRSPDRAATATPTTRHCRSSTATSTGTITTPIRTCSPTPKPAPAPRAELSADAPDEHRRRRPQARPRQPAIPQQRALGRHLLADYLQGWLDAGYQVLVTADHGMNNDRSHNGLLPKNARCRCSSSVTPSAFRPTPAETNRDLRHRLRTARRRPRQTCMPGAAQVNAMTRGKWLAALCLVPFALFFIVFEIAPLVWVMINSLQSEESAGAWPTSARSSVPSSICRQSSTAWRSASGRACSASSSPCSAYSLRRVDSKLRNFVNAFANMTSNFAGVPLAFAFIILLGFNGSITMLLKQAGIIQDFNLYSKTGLIILYTYFQIPLGVLLLYPAFDACAKTGANPLRCSAPTAGSSGGISVCRC
jgi:hypothetical protein